MKIGQFAKKHGVTHDAIRFYIEKGLLVPNKQDGQYRFHEVDSKNMESIIELKQMNFSLSEIHKILTYQRIGGESTEFSRELFLMILEDKQKFVTEELIKYNTLNDYLNSKIKELKTQSIKHERNLGIPIRATELFACPICQKALNVSAGVIEHNMLMNAKMECECGYQSVVEDGIFIDKKAVRKKLLDGKPMPSKEEYIKHASYNHINYLYKGMAKLIEYMMKYQSEPQYLMELNNCVGFFLLQYINYLPEDTTYILIDFDLEKLLKLKKNLELYYSHSKFLFLCCDYNSLPIKNSSIDTVVDFFMSNFYMQENNVPLLNDIVPCLKNNGVLFGSYPYVRLNALEERSKSDDLTGGVIDSRSKEQIMKYLTTNQIKVVEQIDINYVHRENTLHKRGKLIKENQFVYVGTMTRNMV